MIALSNNTNKVPILLDADSSSATIDVKRYHNVIVIFFDADTTSSVNVKQ
jgi:hypothetical protein